MTETHLALVGVIFAISLVGTPLYGMLAKRWGIVAIPNERSLHQYPVPRGGGVAIALPFLVAICVLFAWGDLSQPHFLALFGGGVVLAVVGFVDDVVELSAKLRMGMQIGLAIWALTWLGVPPVDFGFAVYQPGWWLLPFLGLVIVWMTNLYNFMDGVDGMAASGSVFICAAATALLWGSSTPIAAPVAILGAANLGFLFFNWSPAKLFMGDTGSAFQGYVFAVFALISMATGALSVWTWIILGGYYLSDTTTTTSLRILTVKRWYGTHRSHAYQNLARVWRDHRRMTSLVLAIDVLWLLPLAVASVRWPHLGLPLATVAVAPIIGFTLKYGPLYDK